MCGAVVNRFVFHKMKLEFQRNNAWHVFVRLQQIEKLIYVSQLEEGSLFSCVAYLLKPNSIWEHYIVIKYQLLNRHFKKKVGRSPTFRVNKKDFF